LSTSILPRAERETSPPLNEKIGVLARGMSA
jgi:hypothetical protein